MPSIALPRRRAPLVHYVLAGILGVVLTAAVGTAVAFSNGGDPAAFLVTALTMIYPGTALGARIFVTGHTVAADPHGEQSVELQWMQQAGAGAFVDVLVAALVGGAALLVIDTDIAPAAPLLAVAGLAIADATARYLILQARAA